MPIGILREVRNIGPNLTYTPKEGCGARTITLSRAGADNALGQSQMRPLVMCDTDFWPDATYPEIIEAIAESVARDWTTPQQAGTKKTGSQGIKPTVWSDLRGRKYRNTEMIGMMLTKLTYGTATGAGAPPTDCIVSAAPNVLYNSTTKKYLDHTAGDNPGTQIHAEMSMGAQLKALIEALKGCRGFLATKLKIDADLFIEKGSMCDGCRGTWTTLIGPYPGSEFRSI